MNSRWMCIGKEAILMAANEANVAKHIVVSAIQRNN